MMSVVASFVIKLIIDYMMLRLSTQRFGYRIPRHVFFVSGLFHAPIIIAVSTIGQVMPYRLKERKVLAVDTK